MAVKLKRKSMFKRGFEKREKEAPITLDQQQDLAVHARDNNVLVVAGAGSGKTRVLTERIKFLLEEGVPPCNIVAITFTNMAAEEMKERLYDVEGIGDAFIGTIHSFANRVMKLSGENYRIYDDGIDNDFHRELITKYCKSLTFDRYLEYKDMKTQEMMGKITEKELNDFLIPSEQGDLRLIERTQADIDYEISVAGSTQFPESIDTLCKARNVITFEELLKRAEAYFRSINAEIEHVLVDEFQDVGSLEFNFIDSLQADNYFLVGDDWQSIYSFKGGNVKIFMKLIEDGLFSVYYLTNNYRNSRAVLDIADTIISQVYSKIDKTIVPMSQEEGSVQLLSKRTIPVVLDSIKKDGNFRDYFILVRTNKDLFKMQEICEENEVPFTTFKREGMSLADLKRHMDSNRVKILTVHVSKGLEVKNVLLYGNFPVKCPNYTKDEEERKVMYVAVTRAKENLVIMN